MSNVSLESGVGDAPHHAVPLHFLGTVEFMAAGPAAGVKVPDPLDILSDGGDQIAFHDLHVVDVVEQLHVRRIYFLHYAHSPTRVVTHVIVVVAFAVEQLQTNGYAMIFRDFLDAVEADDGIASAFVVAHSFAISGERDHIGNARLGGQGNIG